MGALHLPLKAEIADRLAVAQAAAEAKDGNGAVFAMLDLFNALARDLAQWSYLMHHGAEDLDDKMQAIVDELVFQCLQTSFSKIYPELPEQVEDVLRIAFEDEVFRLEDPLGWAEMNSGVEEALSSRAVEVDAEPRT